jgi:hypothetical protein
MNNQFVALKRLVQCVLLCLIFTAASFAQDEIIAKGNPPLKVSDVENSIAFLEFVFESRFSEDQRQKFQDYAVQDWGDGKVQTQKDIADLVFMNENIKNLDEDKLAKLKTEALKAILEVFNANDQSLVHAYVLHIYREVKGESEPTASVDTSIISQPVAASNFRGTFSNLVGKWERKTSGQSYVRNNGSYKRKP